MRNFLTVALLACALCFTAQSMRIGVLSFPELGHLNPLLSIVTEAGRKGHSADIFGPEFFMPHCRRAAGSVARCITVGEIDTSEFDDTFFQNLVEKPALETLAVVQEYAWQYNNITAPRILEAVKREGPYDVFLVDFGQWSGSAVADVLNVPAVMIWPLTLQFPVQTNPSLPALATAFSAKMNFGRRLVNYLFQRASLVSGASRQNAENIVRESIGAPAVDVFEYYYRRWVVTPSIFGLDVSQPLCPNVVPVGFLHSKLEDEVLPEEWSSWMNSCTEGIVYFNMGSLAVLPDHWAAHFISAITNLTSRGRCVAWKISKKQIDAVKKQLVGVNQDLLRLSAYLPFSPRQLLANQNTKVFVTHCGDTSVYESVEAGVPMVGLPLFADQPDMCQRVQDAGVGIALDKFTFDNVKLDDAIETTISNKGATVRLSQLKQQALSQGGTVRAVEALERAVTLNVSDFTCKHVDQPILQILELESAALTALVVVLLYKLGRSLVG